MSEKRDGKMTKEEEDEKADKDLLLKTSAKIDAIMQLLADGEDGNTAIEKVKKARSRLQDNEDDKSGIDLGKHTPNSKRMETVFHPYKGKRVAIKTNTSKVLDLGDALELQIEARQHGKNLLRSLHTAATGRVGILERQLERMG